MTDATAIDTDIDTVRPAPPSAPAALAEAGCGLEITLRPHRRRCRGGRPHPGRPRRRVQPRVHLPQGLHAQAAPRGPRPAAAPAGEGRDGDFVEVDLARGLGRGRRRLAARDRRPRPRRASPCTWATPNAHNIGSTALRPGFLQGARQRRTSTRRAPSTSGRRRSRAGLMFGGFSHPGARPRPHRLPPRASAPTRSPPTAAWPPRRLAAAGSSAIGRAGRPARRGRPAPHAAPPRPPTAVDRHPARHRRPPARRAWSTSLVADGPGRTWARLRRPRQRPTTRSSRAVAPVHRPRPWPTAHRRSPPRTIRRLARELAAAPSAGGLRPDRHHHAGRSARWRAGWSTSLNVLTGNLDRPGGAMFTKAGRRLSQHPGHARRGEA